MNISKTKCYKDSAVPYLQGLPNEDILEKKESLKSLFNHDKVERIQARRSILGSVCLMK